MTSGIVNGNIVLVYIGGNAAACSDSATFQSDNETIDVTCKDNNGARQILGGSNSWSISLSGKVKFDAAYGHNDLLEAHQNNDTVVVKFGTDVSGDTYVTGNAKITSFTWEAPLNDASTYSVTFTGDGSYTVGTNS